MKRVLAIIAIIALFSCGETANKTPRATDTTDTSTDTTIAQASKAMTCKTLLEAMIKTSNAGAFKHFSNTLVHIRLNNITSEKAIIELYVKDVSDASGKAQQVENTVGWLELHKKNNRLLDITNDPENPIVLRYDTTLFQQNDFYKLCSADAVSNAVEKAKTNDVMLVEDILFNGKLKRFFTLSDFKKVFGKADSVKLVRDEAPCTSMFEENDSSENADDTYLYKNGSRFENHGQQVAVDEFWFKGRNFVTYKGIRIDANTTMNKIKELFPGAVTGKLNEYREGTLWLMELKEDKNGISDGHIKLFFKSGKVYFMHWWFPC